MHSVAVTDGSVESGPAATTYVGVCGGGGGVSRWKASVLQSVDYLDTTAVASPTAMCRELNWLLPCVSVSVEVVVVSVDGRRACCSLRRTWTQWPSPTAMCREWTGCHHVCRCRKRRWCQWTRRQVCCSQWSSWTQWPSLTAVPTVQWLPPHVSVSVMHWM